jgi:hypothetical protein
MIRSVLFRTKVIDLGVGMFVGLVGLAMLLYRGGTWWDPQRHGHSFWENFICDLLHRQTLGGHPNGVSARLALFGMLALVAAVVTGFSLAPEVIPSRRRLGRRIAWFGSLGSICLVLAPLLPSDAHSVLHSIAVVAGGLPALGAFAVLVGALLLEPVAPRALRAVALLLLVLLVVAMALYSWTTFLQGPSLRILPTIARLGNLALLAWLLMVARLVRHRLFVAFAAKINSARLPTTRT